jgi:DNA topoisomerase IB
MDNQAKLQLPTSSDIIFVLPTTSQTYNLNTFIETMKRFLGASNKDYVRKLQRHELDPQSINCYDTNLIRFFQAFGETGNEKQAIVFDPDLRSKAKDVQRNDENISEIPLNESTLPRKSVYNFTAEELAEIAEVVDAKSRVFRITLDTVSTYLEKKDTPFKAFTFPVGTVTIADELNLVAAEYAPKRGINRSPEYHLGQRSKAAAVQTEGLSSL